MRLPTQLGLGVLAVGLLALTVRIGMSLPQYRRLGLYPGATWQHTLRQVGWRLPLAGIGLVGLSFWLATTGIIPFIAPRQVVALIVPLLVACQAAVLYSPEDEPAFEIILTTPYPQAWLLCERLAVLFLVHSSWAVSITLLIVMEETALIALSRWLPLMLLLSGLSVGITLLTRRAVLAILVTCLVWFAFVFLGDLLVERWPMVWPVHLYLRPDHADYALNRVFLGVLGLGLIGLATTLTRTPERLLLGRRQGRRTTERRMSQPAITFNRAAHVNPSMVPQLVALIRYELQMHWQRASLAILWVGLLITPLLGAVLAANDFRGYRAALAQSTLDRAVVQAEITTAMLPVVWLGVMIVALLIEPVLFADTIPRDQQLGLREVLDTLPLPPVVYLMGKLLSVWLAVFGGVVVSALVSGSVWWLWLGPFRLDLFLDLWGVGALGLLLINTGTGLLLAAEQRSTRWALVTSGAHALACLVGLSVTFAIGWGQWFNPARPAIMLYYVLGFPGALAGLPAWAQDIRPFIEVAASRANVWMSLAMGLVQVGVLWLLVWWRWHR